MVGKSSWSFDLKQAREADGTYLEYNVMQESISLFSVYRTTDYGHTKDKSLILFGSNSNPNPK